MSNLSIDIIKRHLESLEIALQTLEKAKKFSAKKFHEDNFIYWATLHQFQIALENIFNIGNHILASVYGKGVEQYADILPNLLKYHIVNKNLTKALANTASFRNKIVHGYLDIDPDMIYAYFKKVQYLKQFASAIMAYIKLHEEKIL